MKLMLALVMGGMLAAGAAEATDYAIALGYTGVEEGVQLYRLGASGPVTLGAPVTVHGATQDTQILSYQLNSTEDLAYVLTATPDAYDVYNVALTAYHLSGNGLTYAWNFKDSIAGRSISTAHVIVHTNYSVFYYNNAGSTRYAGKNAVAFNEKGKVLWVYGGTGYSLGTDFVLTSVHLSNDLKMVYQCSDEPDPVTYYNVALRAYRIVGKQEQSWASINTQVAFDSCYSE